MNASQTGLAIANQAPGRLRGDAWLTVHSRLAQGMIAGRARTRGKSGIVGLLGFASRLRVIWQAAAADDPYADWWLIKIDHSIERAWQRFERELAGLDHLCTGSPVEIGVAASREPYSLRLRFAAPYAFRAARLIAEFDSTVCAALTARYTGLLTVSDTERLLARCSKMLRRIFVLPQGYRHLHVDRTAVAAGTAAARQAAELMGEVPAAVLSRAQRARWHPGPSRPVERSEPVEPGNAADAGEAPSPESGP